MTNQTWTGAPRFWQILPLASKLSIFTSVLTIMIVSTLTVMTIQRERATFRSELEAQAELLLDTLPLTMRDQLYILELDELLDIVQVVDKSETIEQFAVYDRNGIILVDAEHDAPLFSQEIDSLGKQIVGNVDGFTYLNWEGDHLTAARPIYLENEVLGGVMISLSTLALQEKIRDLTIQNTLIAATVLGLGILFTLFFARQITIPLSALSQVAGEMAEGNLDTRVIVESGDEVGQLAEAFNHMVEAIQHRENELRTFAAGLEQAVKERTLALDEQNMRLAKANDELDIARHEAEEANNLKSQFLAAMSHELRTPLNAVTGFSQLLLAGTSGPMNEKQTEKVVRILTNGETLLVLINDLLDLAKIEAGQTEIINRPFMLSLWLNQIMRQLDSLALEKELEFVASIDNELPGMIISDQVRLKQILVNLISNGIKFTSEGSVKVEIKRKGDETFSIAVTDTGMGISAHAQEFIFDEFRQVDGSPQRKYGGTGLGLAIVRKLAVLMGGGVHVESELGKGSTFTVELPLVVELPAKN